MKLDLRPTCEVCGKPHTGKAHTACAKVKQALYAGDKNRKAQNWRPNFIKFMREIAKCPSTPTSTYPQAT